MDVSIILVNYKTKDLTLNCIKSIYEKTTGVDFEIIVVDNNSQDGSAEAIEQEFQNVKVIYNKINVGFGAANNIAIKQAKGKYILCLNTDTLLINNAIKIMFDFMEGKANQQVGVCGGILYDSNNKPCTLGGNLPSLKEVFWKFGIRNILKKQYNDKVRTAFSLNEISNSTTIGYITGADIFFRKSILDKVGLYDENFFMYYEESDLCKRILEKHYEIKLVKEAKIIHYGGKSETSSLIQLQRSKVSELYYFKKHFPNQVLLLKLMYFILYFVRGYICQNKVYKGMFIFMCKGCK